MAIIVAACSASRCSLFAQSDTVASPVAVAVKAAAEVAGVNAVIWAFDRYVIANDVVYNIDFGTMGRNLKRGFVWDNDRFSTNLLGHPYQGGLYFSAARSAGLSFWPSVPYSVAGSLMWEYLMENEPPSINDFISTSIGGAALGEITFRLSGLLIDNRATGLNRAGREILAAIISPMSGLNRVLSGSAWKVRSAEGELSGDASVHFYMAAGYRALAGDSRVKSRLDNGMYVDAELSYGNLFSEDCEKPYDAFTLRTSFNLFSEQPLVGSVNVVGELWGENIPLKSATATLHWGVFQHFSYYDSNTVIAAQQVSSYRLAEAAAVGVGAQLKASVKGGATFVSSAYLTGILLGGTTTDYYRVTNRDYNMGNGFSSKLSAGLLGSKAGLGVKVEDYRLFTWKGYDPEANLSLLTAEEQRTLNAQGDRGNARLTIYNLNFYYRFRKRCILSIQASCYSRDSCYSHFPSVKRQLVESKIGTGYLF
ncbi:MAG: DUF3943 domain-containing protein [Prevotellaceae bacterium]|nr:DUF3943 domain-containing protein [Prevotellaceae bacterium]